MSKRAKQRSFIRRKRAAAQEQVVAALQAKDEVVTDDGDDWGFVTGFRAGDFISHELTGDFVSDNEVQVSDEIFEQFENTFGKNSELEGQAKTVSDGLGKVIGMIGSL